MEQQTLLGGLDPDLLARVTARREALGKAARLGLAVASAPVAFGLLARDAFGQALPQGIKDVLNFALTLEYLEDEFYRTGLAAGGLIPADVRDVYDQISKHETAHVRLLRDALGADAVPKPTFDFTAGGAFPTVFSSYATFAALSQGLEDTGVRAYKGQAAALISNNGVLTTALQIHSVEARHASEIRRLRGQKRWITGNQTDVAALQPVYNGEENTNQGGVDVAALVDKTFAAVTESFDEPLTKEQVLAIAGPFIVG